jgi:redox-sensitive bicupin YhaK (pirin superfamily)
MSDPVVLAPHVKDLGGGFEVRRLLPAAARQAVGPFLFFDHFGPVVAGPADDHDVRPHPHIGLATVTYLFEGAMLHRDSTGVVQRIEPGAVNWMTAGRGIVHSERTPEDLRGRERRTHGLQLWAALPEADEECEPAFSHTPAGDLPERTLGERGLSRVKVLVGAAFGLDSPVPARSPTVYLDLTLAPGDVLTLQPQDTAGCAERAVYALGDPLAVDGRAFEPGQMIVLPEGRGVRLQAPTGARVVLIGGAPLGHRHLYWNFVSSRRERLRQAADDWAAQRFPAVPGETGFIPLPERRPL